MVLFSTVPAPTRSTVVSVENKENKKRPLVPNKEGQEANQKSVKQKQQPPAWTTNLQAQKQSNKDNSTTVLQEHGHSEQGRHRHRSQQRSWQAGYFTSLKTQGLLQRAAGTAMATQTASPLEQATAVLQTLLSTPPERCNGANLVYALTLSAKLQLPSTTMTPASIGGGGCSTNQCASSDDKHLTLFRVLFLKTVQVLREMVSIKRNKYGGLTVRQLCNAAWALAKHVDRDPSLLQLRECDLPIDAIASNILPERKRANSSNMIMSSQIGDRSDKVNLKIDNDDGHEARDDALVVDLAVDELATALIKTLQANSTMAKNGELCMTAWAYGVLRERGRPPGWKTRPRVRRVVIPKKPTTTLSSPTHNSFFQFVHNQEWDSKIRRTTTHLPFAKFFASNVRDDDRDSDDDDELADVVGIFNGTIIQIPSPTVTDMLFDEIATALNQPAVFKKSRNLDRPGEGGGAGPRGYSSARPHTEMQHWRIDICQWSELANVAWAFATHGWSCSSASELVLMRIANETARRLRQEQQYRYHAGFVAKRRTEKKKAKSRDIAQLIWSLGIAQSDNFRLADSLEFVVEILRGNLQHHHMSQQTPFFASWGCADLVQVALSLAHARLDEGDILHSLYQESIQRLPISRSGDEGKIPDGSNERRAFFFWEITILLWAQARLHLTVAQDDVFQQFAEKAVNSIHSAVVKTAGGTNQSLQAVGIGAQEKANLVWSLVILEQYKSKESIELLSKIFADVTAECQVEGCIQLEHAHQLWQALFLLEIESPEAVAQTPGWFREYLLSQWKNEKARPKLSSARHKALSQALTQMGVAHQNEHEEDIDVAIVLEPNALWTHQAASKTTTGGSRDGSSYEEDRSMIKVAVEFDGPNHFTRRAAQRPQARASFAQSRGRHSHDKNDDDATLPPPRSLGHSILKYRLLKKQGWKVIRIPYYEFDKIPFWASMERQRYLQRLLKTHSTLKFSDADISEYKPPVLDRKSRFD
ncbi:hypothetical protein ACA910_013205 [Epithemia clementina (nom. ined.)]